MHSAHRLYHPEAVAERAELQRECEADLAVWIAANGTAVRIPFPTPRCHGEEVANWMALHREERRNAAT